LFCPVFAAFVVWSAFVLNASRKAAAVRRYLTESEVALSRRSFAEAREIADRALALAPESTVALLLAGEAAAGQRQNNAALDYWNRIPDDGTVEARRGYFKFGELLARLGRAREAEVSLRRVLKHAPEDLEASFLLAFVLGAEGRSWECLPLMRTLIKGGRFDVPQLQLAGLPDEYLIDSPQFIESCLSAEPDDPTPQLAQARKALNDEGDVVRARELLEQVVAARPELMEGQWRLGRLLLDAPDEDFIGWHERLPAAADVHPGVWEIRGLWAERHGDRTGAARCFWEALRRDPNFRVACAHLAQSLAVLGRSELAATIEQRATLLGQLRVPLKLAQTSVPPDPEIFRRIALIMESLGRPWEAAAWAHLALRIDGELNWPYDQIRHLQPVLAADPPLTLDSSNPVSGVDLTMYPVPHPFPHRQPPDFSAPVSSPEAGSSPVRFVDDAARAGLNFQYFNSANPPTNTLRIFESTGGGIAVLDFDGDFWPDLYFTQGCPIPGAAPDAPRYRDCLYRNRGDGTFAQVTAAAGLGDERYSQGAAVGDFDNDGFPDLYVGNIGPNRLYHNQGDGTFVEVTAAARVAGNDWTTSCVLADMNGDALPDLYVVNYVTGDEVMTRVCASDGRPRACAPGTFAAAQDRFYLNQGDGRFLDVTTAAGLTETTPGRGLGVVALSIGEPATMSLFVSNDTDPNFFWVPSRNPAGNVHFEDHAVLRGLAFDESGQAFAHMGIAAGDANGDGLIDLFVTNFYQQGSTLYIQGPPGFFADRTRPAGLFEPSFLQLGFGTQFLDADLDGDEDLIVTNGHVNDDTHRGIPQKMPPQFFRNDGTGHFEELAATSLGPYFEGRYLGRGMARLDWNRDGREDVAISHLDAPAALLTNQSPSAGHSLRVHLRGTAAARDAIGARVSLRTGKNVLTRQCTAGDGYLASNGRCLTFGLGSLQKIDEITVVWPSGRQQSFLDIPFDAEVVLIEGRSSIVRIRPDL